jgi:hypothetical protein
MSTITTASDAATPQLQQLSCLIDLVGQAGDVARVEIEQPPQRVGVGVPGTWTRTTGLLSQIDGQIAIYDRLGGPPLPEKIRDFVRDAKRLPTKQGMIVGEAETVLDQLKHLAETGDFGKAV